MMYSTLNQKILDNLPVVGREAALIAVAALILLALEKRDKLITKLWRAREHPLNLAIVRVVMFAAMLWQADHKAVVFFSNMPEYMQVPPVGWGEILQYLPITPAIASTVYVVFAISCIGAMIGLLTRWSALLAVISGVYVLGIPQFYGKINHYHLLIWVGLILAFSRCSDVLSVDSISAAMRRADDGDTAPLQPSVEYGVPIRFIWALLGIAYFFPGTWKLARGGAEWVFSDNLLLTMHKKWIQLGDWGPFVKIEDYPLLLRTLAAGTILFEIGFIFLILFPRARPIAFFSGLSFHTGVSAMMRISFASMQAAYVSFVDWNGMFRRLGRRLFEAPLLVVFDDRCSLCRRTVAILQSLNWYDRLIFIGATERIEGGSEGRQEFVATDCYGTNTFGFEAYRLLIRRIPLFSPVSLVMGIPAVASIGRRVYRSVTEHRTCAIRRVAADLPHARQGGRLRAVYAVGGLLLLVNFVLGAAHTLSSWPFACYPTFDKVEDTEAQRLVIRIATHTGKQLDFVLDGDPEMLKKIPPEKWSGLLASVTKLPSLPDRERRLNGIWEIWSACHPETRDIHSITWLRETVQVDLAHGAIVPKAREEIGRTEFFAGLKL